MITQFNADLFRALLATARISQEELAEELDISQSMVSRYCRGDVKNPNAGTVLKFASYFSVEPDELFKISVLASDDEIQQKNNQAHIGKNQITANPSVVAKQTFRESDKILNKIKSVISNRRLNCDAKIDMINLLLED